MSTNTRRIRNLLFALGVVGSLGFGGSQALAAPVEVSACDGPGQIDLGTCPTGKDCGAYCAGGVGACLNGCCTCRI